MSFIVEKCRTVFIVFSFYACYSIYNICNKYYNTSIRTRTGETMELNHFKDMIFEMLNESDNNMIRDIDTNDKANTFGVTLQDGSVFEVQCRQIGKAI